jgi:hypothetical protein
MPETNAAVSEARREQSYWRPGKSCFASTALSPPAISRSMLDRRESNRPRPAEALLGQRHRRRSLQHTGRTFLQLYSDSGFPTLAFQLLQLIAQPLRDERWALPARYVHRRRQIRRMPVPAASCLIHGGQRRNRTTDTRIFSPFSAVLGASRSITCDACQPRPQPHPGTIPAHPI